MMSKKTVLITGCSSGFGCLAARTFHENGWNVVATMRSPEKETELTQFEDVLVVRLDVTDDISIHAALNQAVDKFGNLEVLVNADMLMRMKRSESQQEFIVKMQDMLLPAA